MYDALIGSVSIKDAMVPVGDVLFGAYVLTGDVNLANIDNGFEYVKVDFLHELQSLAGTVDYVIFDTPPSLSTLSVLALSVADKVVIPVNAGIYALKGLGDMYELLQPLNNKNLSMVAVLLCQYRERLIVNRKLLDMVTDAVAQLQGFTLMDTKIREGVVVSEAALLQQGLYEYDKKMESHVAQDYRDFVKEFLGV